MTSQASLAERFDKSVAHLRDVAKWILTVFAAVAAVLLAGLQLSSIGKVEPGYLLGASLAALLGLGSVLRVVWLSASVLVSGIVNETSLRSYATKKLTKGDIELNDPLLLDGYSKVANFLDDYKRIGSEYERALSRNQKARSKRLEPQVERLVRTMNNLIPAARYAFVLHSFNKAMAGMFYWALIAAVSIGAFAWATNQYPLSDTVFQAPPSPALLSLTADGMDALAGSLGSACVSQPSIPVILLSVEDGKFAVVSIPSDSCQIAKFTVDSKSGTLHAMEVFESTPTPTPPA